MKKSKKMILIIGSIILSSIIALTAILSLVFGEKIKAANSIKELETGLYFMEYEGDYGFDKFLANGGAKNQKDIANYMVFFLSGGLCVIRQRRS